MLVNKVSLRIAISALTAVTVVTPVKSYADEENKLTRQFIDSGLRG